MGNIPLTRESVDSLVKASSMEPSVALILREGGLREVPIAGEHHSLSELVRDAVSELSGRVRDCGLRTVGVLFCHSLPVYAPSEVSFFDACLSDLNVGNVPRASLGGQPCAILHLGIQLAARWLERYPVGRGVIILAGDMVYAPADRIFFNSVMGDAAFAGFLTKGSPRHRVLSCVSEGEIIAGDGELSAASEIAQFRLQNPTRIRAAIERCLELARLGLTDLKYIIPHTPYMAIWDAVSKLLGFPREKILTDYLQETGHLNSTDSILHYVRAVSEGKIVPGDMALLVNPGFGGVRGCTLIRC